VICDILEKVKNNPKALLKTIWFGIDEPVSTFTGREKELESLHGLLTRNKDKDMANITVINQSTTVSGLGGIGKTTLARVYARKYRKEYDGNAIWLNAEDEGAFTTSLRTLAIEFFSLKKEKSASEIMKLVYDHFSDKKCLIVLDNVNIDGFDVFESLPKRQPPDFMKPTLLITSRCTLWKDGIEVLPLDVLTEEEAIAFVQKCIPAANDIEKIRSLVQALQCLPLALQQAAAYIKHELRLETDPIKRYLEEFEGEKAKDLLQYKGLIEDIERTTYITWRLTMETISKKDFGKLALKIMDSIAYFEPNSIPFLVFVGLPADNAEAELSTDTVRSAVSLLVKYSMVNVEIGKGVIHVHRLVQHVLRTNNTESKTDDCLVSNMLLLIKNENSGLARALLPHSECVWRHALKSRNVVAKMGTFPAHICSKQDEYGQYKAMGALGCDSLDVLEKIFGKKDEKVIDMGYYVALAFHKIGNPIVSDKLVQETLHLAKEELGEKHELTLKILTLKARTTGAWGGLDIENFEKEREEINELCDIHLKNYGPNHARTLVSLQNKAKCLLNLNRHDEAFTLLQSVYESRVRFLGTQNPVTLGTRLAIAEVLKAQGRLEEALNIYEEVVPGLKGSLGEEHPQVLAGLHHKADTLVRLERLEEAEELLQHVYEVSRRTLEENPETVATGNLLVDLLVQRREWGRAVELWKDVWELYERSPGLHLDHIYTCQNTIIMSLHFMRFREDMGSLQLEYEKWRQSSGEEHSSTLLVRAQIVNLLICQGNVNEAKEMHKAMSKAVESIKVEIGYEQFIKHLELLVRENEEILTGLA
jgi:tetratricopeptide (TPR) repeat protein